jgi:ComF family protein
MNNKSIIVNKILNTLFPETCPVCSERTDDHSTAPICKTCWNTIRPYSGPVCQRCGKPLVSDSATYCGECLKREPAFDCARSFGLYEGALRNAIYHMKYFGLRRLAGPLAEKMTGMRLPPVDAVIPVPLHRSRHRQREFNQSALVARHAARKLNAELIINGLRKTRETAPQVGLTYKERIKNVRNAFSIEDEGRITGKKIILVDDVVTTGSTIRECAKALKRGGASYVYAASLAHGMSD